MRTNSRFDLWPRPYRLNHIRPPIMRLANDVRKAIAFIGLGEGEEFEASGTCFFVAYGGTAYVITAAHVIAAFGEGPFTVRLNKTDGTADHLHFDPDVDGERFPWFFGPDDSDLAIQPMPVSPAALGWDVLLLEPGFLMNHEADDIVGIGDICYAVGLFRVRSGKRRNLPVVHTGNIAAMPDDEQVQIEDWERPGKSKLVNAFLVELANLPGLSGSPVFVRPTCMDFDMSSLPVDRGPQGDAAGARFVRTSVSLLGIFSAAWDGKQVDLAGVRGNDVRVPVGMGVVIPTKVLIDLLETQPVAEHRAAILAHIRTLKTAKLQIGSR